MASCVEDCSDGNANWPLSSYYFVPCSLLRSGAEFLHCHLPQAHLLHYRQQMVPRDNRQKVKNEETEVAVIYSPRY